MFEHLLKPWVKPWANKEISILRLAKAEKIDTVSEYNPGDFDASETFSEGEVHLPLEGVLDLEKEVTRLQAEKNEGRKNPGRHR